MTCSSLHSEFSHFVSQLLEDWSRTMHDVVSLMRTSKEALGEMFDRFTVAEWIEQKLYPMYSRLSKLRQNADGLRKVSVWPSRSDLRHLCDCNIFIINNCIHTLSDKVF